MNTNLVEQSISIMASECPFNIIIGGHSNLYSSGNLTLSKSNSFYDTIYALVWGISFTRDDFDVSGARCTSVGPVHQARQVYQVGRANQVRHAICIRCTRFVRCNRCTRCISRSRALCSPGTPGASGAPGARMSGAHSRSQAKVRRHEKS